MDNYTSFRLQCIVFALVSASFTNIYITQPVLPILQSEFAADMVLVSFSVSAVILGIAISNLPFGVLADRIAIQPIILGLLGLCAGFFAIHAAAVGSLNRKLLSGQGRANALYVLFYYLGGWLGITGSGFAYKQGGWNVLVTVLLLLLIIPLSVGIVEIGREKTS